MAVLQLLKRSKVGFDAEKHTKRRRVTLETNEQAGETGPPVEASYANFLDELAGMQAPGEVNNQPDKADPDDSLCALAELAEESAELVKTCSQHCAWPRGDLARLLAVVDTAQQAAQRSSWAAVAAVGCPDSVHYGKEWSHKMRRTAVQAAETAEKHMRSCVSASKAAGAQKVVSQVFCKFYAEGRCLRASDSCEFAHDAKVLQPFPLACKTELECIFFSTGQCVRGQGCPYAHGQEELGEVLRQKRGPLMASVEAKERAFAEMNGGCMG